MTYLSNCLKWATPAERSRQWLTDNALPCAKQLSSARFAFAWFFLRSRRDARFPIVPRESYQITEWWPCDENAEVALEADSETNPQAYQIITEQSQHFPLIGLCVAPIIREGNQLWHPDLTRAQWDVQPYPEVARTRHTGELVDGIRAPFIAERAGR